MWETPSVERGKPLERATQTTVGALFVGELRTRQKGRLTADRWLPRSPFFPEKEDVQNMAYRKPQ